MKTSCIIPAFNEERVLSTFSSFTTIFVPFYFFSVGLMITKDMVSWKNIILAIIIFGVVITIKILSSFVHRRLTLKESFKASTMVALLTAGIPLIANALENWTKKVRSL